MEICRAEWAVQRAHHVSGSGAAHAQRKALSSGGRPPARRGGAPQNPPPRIADNDQTSGRFFQLTDTDCDQTESFPHLELINFLRRYVTGFG